jgi:hypothetical protein
MAESIREQIIQRVYEHVAELTSLKVERCRRVGVANRDLFISIWDGLSTPIRVDYGTITKQFQIGVEAAWIANDPSEEANGVIAMIEGQMELIKFGDLVKDYTWQSSQPFYPDTGENNLTSVRVTYEIHFTHPKGNPYILIPQE